MFDGIRNFLFSGSVWSLAVRWVVLCIVATISATVLPLYIKANHAHKAIVRVADDLGRTPASISEVVSRVAKAISPLGIGQDAIAVSKENGDLVIGLEWTEKAKIPFLDGVFVAIDFAFDSKSDRKTVFFGEG